MSAIIYHSAVDDAVRDAKKVQDLTRHNIARAALLRHDTSREVALYEREAHNRDIIPNLLNQQRTRQ